MSDPMAYSYSVSGISEFNPTCTYDPEKEMRLIVAEGKTRMLIFSRKRDAVLIYRLDAVSFLATAE